MTKYNYVPIKDLEKKKKKYTYVPIKDLEKNKDDYAYLSAKEEPMSRTSAAARGLGQSFFGLGDEAVGAAQSAGDLITGEIDLKDLLDRYRKLRDEERKAVKKAYKDRPKYAYGAEIAGSFLPGVGIASKGIKLGNFLKGAAASGGLTGYGLSESDSLKDQAIDTAIGAGLGYGTSKVIGKIAPKILGRTAQDLEKQAKKTSKAPKVMSFLYDMPEEITESYIKNPEAFKKAAGTTTGEISSQFHGEVPEAIKKLLIKQSKESTDLLKKSPIKYKGSYIAKLYRNQADEILNKYSGKVDKGTEASKTLQYLENKAKFWEGFKSVEPERLKREMIDLDLSKIFSKDPGTISKLNAANKAGIRGILDKELKRDNPDYAKKMIEETAESGKLKGWIDTKANKFNKIDNLLRKTVSKSDRIDPYDKKMIDKIQKETGRDWLDDYERTALNELLDKSQTQGSKRVKKWSEIGQNVAAVLGMGGGVGGMTGSVGAGATAAALGTLGVVFGDAVDKYGRRMAYNSLERAAKIRSKIVGANPSIRRKILSDLKNEAVRKGSETAITYQLVKESLNNEQ